MNNPLVPAYVQTIVYDKTGDIIVDRTCASRTRNGSGFVISYSVKACDFLEKVSSGSVVRVFYYIAHHQNYGNDDVFGFRCSRSYFAKILGLSRKTVYSALEFLKKNRYIVENRINGSLEFMVNPEYVTVGSDKKARVREWIRRLDLVTAEKYSLPDILPRDDC